MEVEIKFVRNIFASIVIASAIGLPTLVAADHVPNNLSQDLDPNYIACLMAVDNAETEFRVALQSTCFRRMGDICGVMNELALPSQVIECIYFETQRGFDFLQLAANDLPASVDKEEFFGHAYERWRSGILRDIETLKSSPKPLSIETAVQQSVTMASAAITLFWLARETQTPMEAHVVASFDGH